MIAQQIVFPTSWARSSDPLSLHYSDFKRFSSAPPGSVMLGDSSWLLRVPDHARHDGKLGVADAASLRAFPLGTLSFSATFLTAAPTGGHPYRFADELVVFATSDATTYHGFEFGVRQSLSDGFVYAYSQFPNPLGGVVFQEHRLFANDGRPHAYQLSLVGAAVSFTVDGTLAAIELYPAAPPGDFYVVATAHRASDGWSAAGLGLSVADFAVDRSWT